MNKATVPILLLLVSTTIMSKSLLTDKKEKLDLILIEAAKLKKEIESQERKNQEPSETKRSASSKGLPLGWTRATLIVRESHLEKLKSVSFWDRVTIKSLVDEALETYLTQRKILSLDSKNS